MKDLIDIHTVLSTPLDMEDFHDDPEGASDKLNDILHMVYALIDDNLSTVKIELILGYVWEHWHQDIHLNDLDDDDLVDWVDHLINNWDTIIEGVDEL